MTLAPSREKRTFLTYPLEKSTPSCNTYGRHNNCVQKNHPHLIRMIHSQRLEIMQKRLPPLQNLVAFEAASRLGNFAFAADELALTRSAISQQILNLESWLGQALFVRLARGVRLTEAGALFLVTVQTMLQTLDIGCEQIEPYGNPDSVLIACPPEFAEGWLIPRLPQLREKFPKLEVWLSAQDNLRDIDRLDVDLIISSERLMKPDLICTPFLDDHVVAMCEPGMAKSLATLTFPEVLGAAPLLIDSTNPSWEPWLISCKTKGIKTRRAATTEDRRMLKKLAEEGMGIAMLSRLHADHALKAGRLATLSQIPSCQIKGMWLIKSNLPQRTYAVNAAYDWLEVQAKTFP